MKIECDDCGYREEFLSLINRIDTDDLDQLEKDKLIQLAENIKC